MHDRQASFDAWKARSDPATLAALLDAHQDRVLALCRRVLRDSHDAEEAAQESLLKIAGGVHRIADASQFDRWTATVAIRTALDGRRSRLRRKSRERQALPAEVGEPTPNPEFYDTLARLSQDDRTLVLERYVDVRTLEEMARVRGVSEGAVRKRLARARDRLRKLLTAAFLGVFAMKSKAAVLAAVVLLALLGAWLATHRPASTSPVAAPGDLSVRPPAEGTKVESASTAPEPLSTNMPAQVGLMWKDVPPQYACMASPLIPVAGKNRMPYTNLIMITRDHALSWGMDVRESELHRRMIYGIEQIDRSILKAWGGSLTSSAPHSPASLEDPSSLAAYLIELFEGRAGEGKAKEGVDPKYAFDTAGDAIRLRALALLGSFPDDPRVVSLQKQVLGGGGPPELRGLAAANLVRMGRTPEALPVLSGSDPAALHVFLSALSLGLWEGEKVDDLRHTAGGIPIAGPDSRDPALIAGIVAVVVQRPDRATFLEGVKVLALTSTEPSARETLVAIWEEARRDPQLAVKLMENKYQWSRVPEVTPILHDLAFGENQRVALLAISQMYAVIDERTVETLVRLLRHEDPRRVAIAAGVLGANGTVDPDTVVAALQDLLSRKPEAEVVERAQASLQKLRQHARRTSK